jgi:hypothetical protein
VVFPAPPMATSDTIAPGLVRERIGPQSIELGEDCLAAFEDAVVAVRQPRGPGNPVSGMRLVAGDGYRGYDTGQPGGGGSGTVAAGTAVAASALPMKRSTPA